MPSATVGPVSESQKIERSAQRIKRLQVALGKTDDAARRASLQAEIERRKGELSDIVAAAQSVLAD